MFGFLKKAGKTDVGKGTVSTTDEAMQPEAPYTASKATRARHEVESVFFREFFYQNTGGFIDSLLDPLGLSNLYCSALKESRVRPKYYVDEFGMDSTKTDAGDYLVSCRLPKPEHAGLCYRMHFIFNADFSRKAYYTVERAPEGGLLCLWDEEGNHTTIRPIEQPDWDKVDDKATAMNQEIEEIIGLFTHPAVDTPAS